ncbi:alpha/beta hydrolase [Coraliomargarita parva]|uniref:alpha/beta hydrolase n=1 Tax=Coraliomargarita parva TaxID=3014050 RepID=UPI0022B4BBCD|nr:alpha/beta hydrolase [Coraliomargarita parva]
MSKSMVEVRDPVGTLPEPTFSNVSYGDTERQVMDVWLAKSDRPTPVVVYFHGGGWLTGDKSKVALSGEVQDLLDAGISFVSANYRFIQQSIRTGDTFVEPVVDAERVAREAPPVSVPIGDAARVVQFVRSQAESWNLDKARLAVSGNSAGACSSLWLAFHSDLEDPLASDAIARESTRPCCVAAMCVQTTLDPRQMRKFIPNIVYGGHAFGFTWDPENHGYEFERFSASRDIVLPWVEAYSPYALLDESAPPVYMEYTGGAPNCASDEKDPNHSANFGVLIQPRLDELGIEYEFVYPGIEQRKYANAVDYLIDRLS